MDRMLPAPANRAEREGWHAAFARSKARDELNGIAVRDDTEPRAALP